MNAPEVQLFWWAGCPSHPKAKAMLEQAMTEIGFDPTTIETIQVVTDHEARAFQFVGSPTIHINGADVQPPGPGFEPALTCRAYTKRNGKISSLPDMEDIQEALKKSV